MTRRDWLLLLAITLLGAGLRFYQLGIVPPGPQFDEAFNALDAQLVLIGGRPLFLPANGGREVLYTYLQAAMGMLLGLNIFSLRLVSAIAGTLTVPAVYLLVRRLFNRHSQALAALTTLALAVSYWHIHFSHYGIRVILMPLLLCAIFGCFWLGMEAHARWSRLTALVIGGALTGLSIWTNPTGRFVPFVIAPYVLWLLWRYPQRRRLNWENPFAGALLFGGVAFVVFLPLGLEFWRHPEFFTGHASEVSIFAERVSGDSSPWLLLGNNIWHVLGMFSFNGDLEWAHGLANRPVFDWFMAIPFYIGVVVWLVRLAGGGEQKPESDRDALVLFALWAAVMLAPSVLSEAAPNYSRTLPAIPAVMLAAGLGLTWIVTQRRVQPRWGWGIAAVLISASVVVTCYDYFVRFPTFREVYYVFDADKLDALNWMKAQAAEGNTIYLSPLWSEHATVTFLRDREIESLDALDAMVLPAPGKGAVYAFPAEQEGFAKSVARQWKTGVEIVNDKYDRPLMAVVRVPPNEAAQWPPDLAPEQTTDAKFDEAPSLLGLRAGKNGRDIYLYWRAEQRMRRDLTSFVHLVNESNQHVGQADKSPGDGTFRTPRWSVGERIIQRYTPEITDFCAGGEQVRVVTGWYEYAAGDQRRPRSGAPGDSALAGEITLPFVSAPRGSVQPGQANEGALTKSVALVGIDALSRPLEPGAPFQIALYMTGNEVAGQQPVTLTLQGGGELTPLWTGPIAPGAAWKDGEVICRRVQARVPVTVKPGAYTLAVTVADASVALQDVAVVTSMRIFDAPPVTKPVAAVLGDAIQLYGYDEIHDSQSLTVTLVWQMLAEATSSEQVFVHLVDSNGQIVAQSDAVPAGGYGADQWIKSEYVLDTHVLALPPALPAGRYELRVGMYDPTTGQRLTAAGARGQQFVDGAVIAGAVELP